MAYKGVAKDLFSLGANQTANRALATQYQNNNDLPMLVSLTLTAGGSAPVVTVAMGSVSGSLTTVQTNTLPVSVANPVQFIVPAGMYYMVSATQTPTITIWQELV
jgi:hypothetical protein